MKFVIILTFMIYIYSIKEEDMRCAYESTINQVSKLSDCQKIETKEGNQCCIIVLSYYDNDHYFCEEFKDSVGQDEIDTRINEYIKENENQHPGLSVKGQGSCSGDVKPYIRNKCTIEDTQKDSDFGNCKKFKKDDDSNYCCLFSGKISDKDSQKDTNVYFCKEIDNKEIKTKEDMKNITRKIDENSEMFAIDYLNCSPEIPDKEEEKEEEDNGSNLQKAGIYKLFFLISLLIIEQF